MLVVGVSCSNGAERVGQPQPGTSRSSSLLLLSSTVCLKDLELRLVLFFHFAKCPRVCHYLLLTMGLRDVFKKKSAGTKAGEASAGEASAGEASTTEDADSETVKKSDHSPLGLDVLVEGVEPTVEYIPPVYYRSLAATDVFLGSSIVAIHGLNGHREKTWTAANQVNWLRDANMLPSIVPNARIMSWGYDANTHSTKELSGMYLYEHANKLVSDLSLLRRMNKV